MQEFWLFERPVMGYVAGLLACFLVDGGRAVILDSP